jgi:hypothetical protein
MESLSRNRGTEDFKDIPVIFMYLSSDNQVEHSIGSAFLHSETIKSSNEIQHLMEFRFLNFCKRLGKF